MLKTKDETIPTKSGVGVIVARLQVAELTQGHKELIESVISRHNSTVIILGSNGTGSSTKNNPLDFRTRQLMVNIAYPDVQVGYVKDCFDDDLWSRNLDHEIRTHISIGSEVTLYGGRDSFSEYYTGSFKTKILESKTDSSGTESRNRLKEMADKSDPKFREGAIWANQNRYPTVYPVVDVAIINEKTDMILLGRKENEPLWRLPGGFVDVCKEIGANALENTVKRETYEETSLEIGNVQYVGSFFVNDWRYRSEVDCIMTVLFKATYIFGAPKAGDDLVEVQWFPLHSDTIIHIGPKSHIKLFDSILESIAGEKNAEPF